MKAILVIEMPKSCDACPLFCGHYSDMCCRANGKGIDYPYPKETRQDWCPLRPAPEKRHATDDFVEMIFNSARNICIDEFMGYTSFPLKVGGFIHFDNAEDLMANHNLLEKRGITTDFAYEKDGEKGWWLVIKSIKGRDGE